MAYRVVKKVGSIIWIRGKVSITELEGYNDLLLIAVTGDITDEFLAREEKKTLINNTILSNLASGINPKKLYNILCEYKIVKQ